MENLYNIWLIAEDAAKMVCESDGVGMDGFVPENHFQ